MTLLLLGHAAVTWAMVGLIWFVQVVHYPLFARVDETAVPAFAHAHQRRTGWIVAPLMLVELATAAALVFVDARDELVRAAWIGLGLLVVIWLSTFLVQVPLHRRLARGDRSAESRLVTTNWVRTIGWTMRGVLTLWLLAAAGRA